MKIIRLENTNFGFSSFNNEEVDKIIEFNSESGISKIHILGHPQIVNFDDIKNRNNLVEKITGGKLCNNTRIIHRQAVLNAYSAPFKIYLDVTFKCPLSCSFCLSGSNLNTNNSLPFHVIEKIAKEIKELGVMYVKIGGGDPFLHDDFPEIIKLLRSAGCYISISTNSTSMSPDIIKILSENKVRTSVSIEGMETANDSIRGLGHFQKALNTLEILKSSGINCLLRTTLLKQNLEDVPKLIELAKRKKVKIKFSYCRPAGRAVYNQTMLTSADYLGYSKVLKLINDPIVTPHVLIDEGMMFDQSISDIAQKLFRGRMCGAANRSMHINADGKVSPCVFLGPIFSYGKIYQDGNIDDFWRSKVGNKFEVTRKIRQPYECDSCSRLCKNECPSNRQYFWGNFEKQDPNCICEVQKYNTKD